MTIYALYKGDKFIDVGTAKEIAERQGMLPKRIRYLAHSKREKTREEKNRKSLVAVVVEQERKMPTTPEGRRKYINEYTKQKRYLKELR